MDNRVFSADRIRRLRLTLIVVVAAAGFLLVLGALVLATGDEDFRFAGAFGVAAAAAIIGVAGLTLRALPAGTRNAKMGAFATAGLLSLVGVMLIATVIGWLFVLLGIAVLALALIPDEPGAVR